MEKCAGEKLLVKYVETDCLRWHEKVKMIMIVFDCRYSVEIK